MILNASAANGSSSSALRSSSLVASSASVPCDRRHVQRRRQVVDDGVEQRLHALVLEGACRTAPGTTWRRRCVALRIARAELVDGRLLLADVLLHEVLVVVGQLLEQLGGATPRPSLGTRRGSPGPPTPRPVPSLGQISGRCISTRSIDAVEVALDAPTGAGRRAGWRRGGRIDHVDRARRSRRPMRSILLTKQMRGTL